MSEGGKRRGEDRQLRPDQVEALEAMGDGAGIFRKADAETIAKRRIVKINRGSSRMLKQTPPMVPEELSTTDGTASALAPRDSETNPFAGFAGLTGPSSVEGARPVSASCALDLPNPPGSESGNQRTEASNPFAGFTGLTAPSLPPRPMSGELAVAGKVSTATTSGKLELSSKISPQIEGNSALSRDPPGDETSHSRPLSVVASVTQKKSDKEERTEKDPLQGKEEQTEPKKEPPPLL